MAGRAYPHNCLGTRLSQPHFTDDKTEAPGVEGACKVIGQQEGTRTLSKPLASPALSPLVSDSEPCLQYSSLSELHTHIQQPVDLPLGDRCPQARQIQQVPGSRPHPFRLLPSCIRSQSWIWGLSCGCLPPHQRLLPAQPPRAPYCCPSSHPRPAPKPIYPPTSHCPRDLSKVRSPPGHFC